MRLAPASRHDDALAPTIDTLCRNAGVRPCEIGRVAVSVGPGGFTAVRIAVATGQMIALASGAACFAVPTALGVAYSMSNELPPGSRATILLAWKRGDSWRHRFERRADGHWTELDGGVLTPLSKPVEPGDALVCDEAIREMVHSAPASWLPPRFDPVGIARASWQMKPVDPALLLPLYPREPEAVTKWRELGRG